jgi:hypothetical protein
VWLQLKFFQLQLALTAVFSVKNVVETKIFSVASGTVTKIN